MLEFPPNRQDRRTLPNGTEYFGVSGRISNVGKERRIVPTLLIVLRDEHNHIVYSWEVTPPKRVLAPGEALPVIEAVTDIPRAAKFAEIGWTIVVAPELEFYLTEINSDPDLPIVPPRGRSGRAESSPQPYGLEAVTEYEDLIEMIYEYAETAELSLDTMIHESGTAQLEINFLHGDPVQLADQVQVFKRIVRQVALQHGVYATFMAKPMARQPGSAMHVHISMVGLDSGPNLFADDGGADSDTFRHFVGGLQKYLPEVTPLLAPNVNSFRRMRPSHSAPINVQWGYDNRSCGLRVPISDRANRRIENRLPGADASPYLALAATLICGYLGIEEAAEPSAQATGNAYHHPRTLPRTLDDAIERMNACTAVRALLGEPFFTAFVRIKEAELEAFQGVISSWERDHLLLKV